VAVDGADAHVASIRSPRLADPDRGQGGRVDISAMVESPDEPMETRLALSNTLLAESYQLLNAKVLLM